MNKTGEVIKIHPAKKVKGSHNYYKRIEFKIVGGGWAKTDIVGGFRNSRRWQPVLLHGIGTIVHNLKLKGNQVDADSFIRIEY